MFSEAAWLVQDEQVRVVHLGLGNAQALPLTAGEPLDRAVRLVGQSHQLQGLRDSTLDPRPGPLIEEPGDKAQGFAGRHVLVVARILRQIADSAPNLVALLLNILAKHPAAAAGRLRQTQQQLDRRRLPGAVRPQEPADGIGVHLQVQRFERLSAVICLAQAVRLDDRVYGCLHDLPPPHQDLQLQSCAASIAHHACRRTGQRGNRGAGQQGSVGIGQVPSGRGTR
jgi:hypothetical protein